MIVRFHFIFNKWWMYWHCVNHGAVHYWGVVYYWRMVYYWFMEHIWGVYCMVLYWCGMHQ